MGFFTSTFKYNINEKTKNDVQMCIQNINSGVLLNEKLNTIATSRDLFERSPVLGDAFQLQANIRKNLVATLKYAKKIEKESLELEKRYLKTYGKNEKYAYGDYEIRREFNFAKNIASELVTLINENHRMLKQMKSRAQENIYPNFTKNWVEKTTAHASKILKEIFQTLIAMERLEEDIEKRERQFAKGGKV